ncbi:MAG: DUF1573 domain-containing protein [Bacteroidota bacterium]
MKKIALILCLFLSTGLFAQTEKEIVFTGTTHSFGKIKQGAPVTFVFTFTNNAAKPAVIEFVNPDCGCTTPDYSKDPILKGKSSKIKVTYNAETMGIFKKNVNVKFVSMQLPVVLTIDGEVVKAAAKSKSK